MAWVWAVIVAIAVGLPVAAWWLGRNLKPPRQRAGRPGFGPIDHWLRERYGLGALDRWQVEDAIYGDVRKLADPRLREAARGAASELLSGRLKAPWLIRWGGWLIMGIGLAVTTFGIVAHFAGHHLGEMSAFYLAEGVTGILLGAVGVFWAPRQMRRNLIRLDENHANDRSSAP